MSYKLPILVLTFRKSSSSVYFDRVVTTGLGLSCLYGGNLSLEELVDWLDMLVGVEGAIGR